jgi:hypothetical protein
MGIYLKGGVLLPLLTLLIVGCGAQTFDQKTELVPIDKKQAELMPQSVAMEIFKKHGYLAWVKDPYLVNTGGGCGTESVPVEFQQIVRAVYKPKFRVLQLSSLDKSQKGACSVLQIYFSNVTEDQSRELTTAACSLGAQIESFWAQY